MYCSINHSNESFLVAQKIKFVLIMILTSSALVQRQTALVAEHAATTAPGFEVSMVSKNKHHTMGVNLRHITAASVALNQPSTIGALAPPLILTQLLQHLLCFRS